MNIQEVIRNINHPDPLVRKEIISKTKTYLLSVDLDKDTKVKKFIRKLSKLDCSAARDIVTFVEKLKKGPETRFDQYFFELVLANGLYKKEFYEAREFYKKVKPLVFSHYNIEPGGSIDLVVDMCAGNGLNGLYWILQESASQSHLVDLKKNSNFTKMESALLEKNQLISEKYLYVTEDIDQYDGRLPCKSLLTSIHGCGELTDKVIDKGIKEEVPFAVMPCCYNYRGNNIFDQKILQYCDNKKDFINGARTYRIQQAGFSVILKEIDPDITQMNLIIVGFPKISKNS